MTEKSNQFPQWEVFIQAKNGGPYEHAGSVHATDKNMALQNARDIYTRRNEGRSLWVVQTDNIFSTTREEEAEFFDPAEDKIYRTPNFYKMPAGTTNL
ncbi:MAG TPA: 1,2-phenylacetyl-CoA epoxidase subunit B [Bacteroidia bacterium]|nr:1,2-phenylacetyl-CoA epoxidase subunit B [Bacteroidota bacterium]MBP9789540.1 1,2-phenylacetyl-CoA epoxidase subunit B [Bacteroidia bacterium]MBK7429512.1 1,2-phenylacetyl-CoA epoxidase subunit B [Bacteroidota bacterium]MBK7570410.1 1,2-phenylacetyl-CoA epoxidase subunit B [Bacteroidota bacterium]MBK8584571.1 1,2-phenylacetyl-CoA epoxidase subunit B [Bacteroidota bacterium]